MAPKGSLRITKHDAVALGIVLAAGNVTPEALMAIGDYTHPRACDLISRAEKVYFALAKKRLGLTGDQIPPAHARLDEKPTARLVNKRSRVRRPTVAVL